MKKIWLILGIILCLSACNNAHAPSQSPSPTPAISETAAPEDRTISIEENFGQFESMTRFEDCQFSITHEEDEIILLTDAKRGDDGEFMWDDSQNWALIVENPNGVYPLYEAYLHGKLNLNVSEYYENDGEPVPVIRLTLSTGAGFEIREYRYNNNEFTEKKVFQTGEINEISINRYERKAG